jgi:asparagine synthase (glutamine-hydrolysing)
MCGIAGVLNFTGAPVPAPLLNRMTDALAHRGPDGRGIYVGGAIGLGHRRLAILDLTAAAAQPMANKDGTLRIAYNGELYNHLELAADLRARGHRYRSRSDTETVLHAYEEWGEACLQRFDGIFAFALWDAPRRRLLLARDRFGVKPLYYRLTAQALWFASEVKGLLAVRDLEVRVCPEALGEYFTFQNVLTDRTLFDGVRLLPPATTLIVEEGQVRQSRYWELPLARNAWTEADAADAVRAAFQRAVERQLMSDVPVGAYLSGGMDSASITAVASRRIPRLMTFTGGFDLSSVTGLELAFDERADAERVSAATGTEHYEMVLHAGDLAWALPRVVWHLEDLRVGMCYQNYYIARLASRFVKVVLAGAGGDELFGGYPWRYAVVGDARDEDDFARRHYRYWCRLVPDEAKPAFFTPEVWAKVRAHPTADLHRAMIASTRTLHPVERALDFEARSFLHGLLVVEDKLSMAHGLEARVPFLDKALAELALSLPWEVKVSRAEGKRVLRRAMGSLLSEAILAKPKQGFSPPDESWHRGKTMGYIRAALLDPKSLERGYFQPAAIRRVIEEHVTGRANHRLLIWSLLCFEWWNRIFVDGQPPEPEAAPGPGRPDDAQQPAR